MRVEWKIKSEFNELRACCLGCEWRDQTYTDISADLWFDEEDQIFEAIIRGLDDYGWIVFVTKRDASLPELMAWVEEELKFRCNRPRRTESRISEVV